MRILIIEDEKKTAAFLSKGLKENGFTVDIAENGVDGLNALQQISYDLAILDVMMPLMDGWSVLSTLRNQDIQTRILLLTARDSVEDRVKGLGLGADDYLVKPFAFSELLARIQSLLRRGTATEIQKIKCADMEIDAVKHCVTRNNIRIDLTPKEFQLLLLMARHPGEVLSRTVIAEQVWDINFNSDTNVVDVAIRRLRNKVDDPFENKLIHTIRGVGYSFEQRN
ncbi:MAG: heavy metal response regulator transcription factor [Methylococcales bacterium]|nr:heavy metal response regulator transcription factor [Methylococcales bacterium]